MSRGHFDYATYLDYEYFLHDFENSFSECNYNTLKSQKNWYRHTYESKGILNQSEYSAAVGNAYIRQQVFSTVVRSINVATMISHKDLSEFEGGVIVGAREMGYRIFDVAQKFGFPRTTISRVYREYRESGKISSLRHH